MKFCGLDLHRKQSCLEEEEIDGALISWEFYTGQPSILLYAGSRL